jgi:hypothetical protein
VAPKNLLHKQLEEQRFLHGIAYVEKASLGLKILSTSELVHLNRLLVGDNMGSSTGEPWRFEQALVVIPSGRTHQFNILTNPIVSAREILGNCWQTAGNQELLRAAVRLYSELVLHHLFKDANRRTAVLATLWLASSHGSRFDGRELAEFPIGDLRDPVDLLKLEDKLKKMISLG